MQQANTTSTNASEFSTTRQVDPYGSQMDSTTASFLGQNISQNFSLSVSNQLNCQHYASNMFSSMNISAWNQLTITSATRIPRTLANLFPFLMLMLARNCSVKAVLS
ncbi:hypothetical protein PM082_015030 [Marasmius tenuissimus]|nr:hypothetical protein PM082_015030 [Marasmius tenuissimus]